MYLLVIGILALLAFQAKVVMPYVYDIAASGLFMEDSGDDPNRISSHSSRGNKAFDQCNTHLKDEYAGDYTLSFSDQPDSSFNLGNYEYIVSAHVDITPEDGVSYTKKYACRIQYSEKDDMTQVDDPDNWSILGISELENDLD